MHAHTAAEGVKPLHHAAAGIFVLLLSVSCLGILHSLFASLFGGPAWTSWLFLAAVLLTLAGNFLWVLGRCEPAGPKGLSGAFPRLRLLEAPLIRGARIVAVAWLISVPTFFISSGLKGGIENGPVFASEPPYELVNHGEATEVARARYWVVGVSEVMSTHTTVLLWSQFLLYAMLFGDPLARWKPQAKRSKAADPVAAPDAIDSCFNEARDPGARPPATPRGCAGR